ncbi:MAG: formylmethanofuran dehydrogenase subunit E family protein [Candidatus Omnitrophica bacterium]|nr:formylmethanofuran dehydrogenase subunit E family protein [Candidatus Omnitrophota bacterium]MDD5553147.1 formylmethanofuran dehydrogenase subunit E family protein [Candidatus Omnitrophota bacterium]
MKSKITLNEAVKFHGHLGPYLVLGILAGDLALKRLGAKKYFGINVKVWGVSKRPRSCFIDGIQLSTGATYGKGNIEKLSGPLIKAEFRSRANSKKIILKFRDGLISKLTGAKTHRDAESLAKEIYKKDHDELFNLIPNT